MRLILLWIFRKTLNTIFPMAVCVCVCVYIYYLYIYIHTHTHTHTYTCIHRIYICLFIAYRIT